MEKTYRMENVKKHFEEEAQEFDRIILNLIPYYGQMLEALILSIPFQNERDIKVIDLGCGTGTIAKLVKEKYSNSNVTCVDFAEKMDRRFVNNDAIALLPQILPYHL